MSSIPNGSLSPVAVFSMGFGTGADVGYPTLQCMVDKLNPWRAPKRILS